jgi:hypothetical protein
VEAFRVEAARAGVTIPSGNTGTVTDDKDHVTLAFAYDGSAVLNLTITDKPWYVPASMIWSELDKFAA